MDPDRPRRVRPPRSGYLLTWGLDENGDGPDLICAFAPGSRSAARALGSILRHHARDLEAAGADFRTLRITGQPKKAIDEC